MILWKDTYSVSFVCLLVSSSLLALSIFIQPPPPPLLPSRYMSAEPFPASQAVHAKKNSVTLSLGRSASSTPKSQLPPMFVVANNEIFYAEDNGVFCTTR